MSTLAETYTAQFKACKIKDDRAAAVSSEATRILANRKRYAALVGGLTTGTWAGAAAGASAQVIRNRTAAKNPGKPVVP